MKNKRSIALTIMFWVLMVALIGSVIFAAYKAATTPETSSAAVEGERLRSDYILMLTQCALGLVVVFLPSALERRFHFTLPNFTSGMYFIFLYCAIYLGEVRSFYYLIPHWDTMLHAFSAMMLGAFGFALVSILNDSQETQVHLSPRFVVLFAFCFALATGALWEIYEFAFDGFLQLNMQKFRTEAGVELVGRAALADTMKDLITDAVGALIICILGAIALKKQKDHT